MAVPLRWGLLAVTGCATLVAAWLFIKLADFDGWSSFDSLRLALSSACVFWLSWGAFGGLLGLTTGPRPAEASGPLRNRTALLMPIYNEDPPSTFARIAAVSARLTAAGVHDAFDIFVLSDSQALDSAAREALWFERLLTDCAAREQIFYRRRTPNTGRKAGNIEDFIRRSGAAYAYALVLDADSLMEADALVTLVRRMDATPELGLLQTLPRIVHARSIFGRAVQFAAEVYTPSYANGTARLQGAEGPYWGHNAIFRISAFAQSCGLPSLSGRPPFGGHILSHDYVEAALLARRGWLVRLDTDIGGSFEEGPDNILDYVKRDQRWCQGNLQHAGILLAPGLRLWNRITLLQGVLSYLMPPLWLLLLAVNIVAAQLAQRPRFYGGPDWSGWVLIGFVAALLILPKLAVGTAYAASMPAEDRRSAAAVLVSMLAEIVLSTLIAPVVLMFGVRSVLRVLSGWDGGWPPSNRADSSIGLGQALAASWWISLCGAAGLAAVAALAPAVAAWCLPVALPMLCAPLVIVWTNRPSASRWLWSVPGETAPAGVLREYRAIHGSWTGAPPAALDQAYAGTANVLP